MNIFGESSLSLDITSDLTVVGNITGEIGTFDELKVLDASPVLSLCDNDSVKTLANTQIQLEGSDGIACKLGLSAGILTLDNQLTNKSLILKTGVETLTIDETSNLTSLTTDLNITGSYQENGVEGEILKYANGSSRNMIAGSGAGLLITGSDVVGIGYLTQSKNISGKNTSLGSYSLRNGIGTKNVAIGEFALAGNSTLCDGDYNIAVGSESLISLSTGDNNVVAGYFAAGNITTGSNNTCIGYQANDLMTTGSQNVFIGSGATCANGLPEGYNNMIGIGYNITNDTANSCVIGNSSNINIRPSVDNITDLGTSTKSFKTAYVRSITGTTSIPTNDFPDTATSATTPAGYIITTSSDFNGATPGWKAFDSDLTSGWFSGENYSSGIANGTNSIDSWNSEYITVQSPSVLYLISYSITVNNTTSAPKHFRIYGSNDGATWTQIDEQNPITGWAIDVPKEFTLSSPSDGFLYFSLAVREISTTGQTLTRIYDINFVSTEDCPTVSSLEINSCMNVAGNMGAIKCNSITFPKAIAEIYWDSNTTAMSQAGVWTKVSGGTSIANSNNEKFTHTSPNRLTYTGSKTMVFHAGSSFSFAQVGGGTVDWLFALYKNGTIISGSRARRQTSNNSYGSTAIHKFITLATNDYVELWVSGDGSSNDIIISDFNLFILATPNDNAV